MRKTLETSVLFATKTDVNAQNKAKSETGVHYNRAAKHGKKLNRKNIQGVGAGVKTPQKTQNLLRVFNLLPKLLPSCYLYVFRRRTVGNIIVCSK